MLRSDLLDQLVEALSDLTARVPSSPETEREAPAGRAKELTVSAAAQAAAMAGALSLPPGPLGMLTIVPDLLGVWHIQRQLVADIAASYGKSAELHRETMVYCLFRHATAQVARDLMVRVGERMLLRRGSVALVQQTLRRIGLVISQRAVGRSVARWLPIAGAVGVGAYAYYDTVQVGRTAQELFESDFEGLVEGAMPSPGGAAG